MAIILVVMIGVGLAEAAGLIAALIRKLVGVSSRSTLTFIIVLLGVISSIASDAGYLVLIPLGAAAFKSVGRNPLAGHRRGVRGRRRRLRRQLPDHAARRRADRDHERRARGRRHEPHIDLAANLYFGIGSTIFVTIVLTFVTAKLVERRLGALGPRARRRGTRATADETPDVSPEAEARGLRCALWATLAVLVVITLLTVIPGAPLRNPETGKIIGDSPFMDSLIVIITLVFFAAGLAYGRGAGTIKTQRRGDRHDHEVVGRPGQPALPVPADRAVHRVLQLHQHRARWWR